MHAVVYGQALEYGNVEFVCDQRIGQMARERGMALEAGNLARPEALVGDRVLVADAEGEGRVVVEKEGRGMIVVKKHQYVGVFLGHPSGHRLIALEQWRPVRVVLQFAVEGSGDGGNVRGADAANDACHVSCAPVGRIECNEEVAIILAGAADAGPAQSPAMDATCTASVFNPTLWACPPQTAGRRATGQGRIS
ncbi:unannotated protein [freshwater metagenome]|uniref:Unannotated protein n=1 Tax=freshwater metagenome TaxID=449393 RepID=A0A6J7RZ89_9ZZZZ